MTRLRGTSATGPPPSALAVEMDGKGTTLQPEKRVEVLSLDLAVAWDVDQPLAVGWQVEDHRGGRWPGRDRLRLHCPAISLPPGNAPPTARTTLNSTGCAVLFRTSASIGYVPTGTGCSTSAHAEARTDNTTPRVTDRSIATSSHRAARTSLAA